MAIMNIDITEIRRLNFYHPPLSKEERSLIREFYAEGHVALGFGGEEDSVPAIVALFGAIVGSISDKASRPYRFHEYADWPCEDYCNIDVGVFSREGQWEDVDICKRRLALLKANDIVYRFLEIVTSARPEWEIGLIKIYAASRCVLYFMPEWWMPKKGSICYPVCKKEDH